MRKRTLIGCRSELGGSPLASSMAVIPRDQMSAWQESSVKRYVWLAETENWSYSFYNPFSNETKGKTQHCHSTDWELFYCNKTWPKHTAAKSWRCFLHPQTHLEIIRWLFDDLWSHPERRAHKCVPLDLGVRQLSRHPEICQLHVTLLWQEHVGRWRTQGK